MMVMPATQEQYFRIPAHRFNQGRRSVFTFALTLEQLDGMLPRELTRMWFVKQIDVSPRLMPE